MNRISKTKYPVDKPLMVWDGECPFCRLWIDWWRQQTGTCTTFEPLQSAIYRFRDIPTDQFKEAVAYINPEGDVYWGAGAVFASLSCQISLPFKIYRNTPPFRWITERAYHFISKRRDFFFKVSKMLLKK